MLPELGEEREVGLGEGWAGRALPVAHERTCSLWRSDHCNPGNGYDFPISICLTYLSMHGSLLGDFRSFELVGLKPVKPEFFFFFFLWLSFRWTVMFLTVILHKLHFSSAILRSEVGELFSTVFPIHRSGQAVFTS